MSKIIYTEDQISRLKENTNVSKCSQRSIGYSRDFKLKAIRQYNQDGLTSTEIFRQAGFDLTSIGKDKPKECLRRWNRKYRQMGLAGLQVEQRGGYRNGGRPKTKNLTETERIKRLELEVAYLKAENDFLVKLRFESVLVLQGYFS
jgi:transposase-like protein